jgi:hypothetical protein
MYSGDIFKAENALRYQGSQDIIMPLAVAKDLILLNDIAKRIRRKIETLEYHTAFINMHADLLWCHNKAKHGIGPIIWPIPYRDLIQQAKEVHGHFKDSKNE